MKQAVGFLGKWVLGAACALLLGAPHAQAQEGEGKQEEETFNPSFKLGGYAFTQYEVSKEDGGDGKFEVKSLALILSGDLAPRWSFLSEIEYEENGSEIELEQAVLSFRPAEAQQVGVGVFLAPVGIFNENYRPFYNRMTSRPLAMEQVIPVGFTQIGLQAKGSLQIQENAQVSYAAYVGNGLREAASIRDGRESEGGEEQKNRLGAGGRIAVTPFEALEIGASGYTTKYSEDGERRLSLYAAHSKLDVAGFELQAEYAGASLEVPSGHASPKIRGLYAQLGYRILEKLMLLYRFDQLKYQDAFHGAGFEAGTPGAGIDEDARVHNLGAAFYPRSNLLFKAEARIWDDQKSDEELEFVLEAAFRF